MSILVQPENQVISPSCGKFVYISIEDFPHFLLFFLSQQNRVHRVVQVVISHQF